MTDHAAHDRVVTQNIGVFAGLAAALASDNMEWALAERKLLGVYWNHLAAQVIRVHCERRGLPAPAMTLAPIPASPPQRPTFAVRVAPVAPRILSGPSVASLRISLTRKDS